MGTATMGVDYPAIPDSIIILPNDSSATLTIPAYLDGIVEPTETVVIFLSTICGLTETIYDSIVLNIQDNVEAEALATGDTTICEGATIEMHGYGGSDFLWFPNTYLSSDTIYNPIFTPPNPGTYLYNLAVLLGPCSDTTQVEIQVAPGPMAYAGPNDSLCIGASLVLNGTGGVTHLWEGSNITTPDTSLSITVSPTSSGEYILTVTDAEGCIDKDTTQIEVVALPMVNAGLDATILFQMVILL